MNYKKDHPDFGKHSPISSQAVYLIACLLEQRKQESDKIREKYPDRIPVICEKSSTSKLPNIDKTK